MSMTRKREGTKSDQILLQLNKRSGKLSAKKERKHKRKKKDTDFES